MSNWKLCNMKKRLKMCWEIPSQYEQQIYKLRLVMTSNFGLRKLVVLVWHLLYYQITLATCDKLTFITVPCECFRQQTDKIYV